MSLTKATSAAALALALSACGGAPATPPQAAPPAEPAPPIAATSSASPADAPAPTSAPEAPSAAKKPIAPLFAPLFERDRTWRYQVTTVTPSPKKKTTTQITCRVAQARSIAAGTLSVIACADDKRQPVGGDQGPAGVYFVNDKGLWSFGDRNIPEDLGKLKEADLDPPEDKELVMKASPAAGKEKNALPGRKENDDDDGSWGYERKVTREGELWCSTIHFLGGEETESSICLKPEAGPARGSSAPVTGVGPDVRWQEAGR